MIEILKEVDSKLLNLVLKFEKTLPEFNSGNDAIDLTNRIAHASKDSVFNNELIDLIELYKNKVSDEDLAFLKNRYQKRYEYGFNFPASDEKHNEMIQPQ